MSDESNRRCRGLCGLLSEFFDHLFSILSCRILNVTSAGPVRNLAVRSAGHREDSDRPGGRQRGGGGGVLPHQRPGDDVHALRRVGGETASYLRQGVPERAGNHLYRRDRLHRTQPRKGQPRSQLILPSF